MTCFGCHVIAVNVLLLRALFILLYDLFSFLILILCPLNIKIFFFLIFMQNRNFTLVYFKYIHECEFPS